jgi:hypothetical protein
MGAPVVSGRAPRLGLLVLLKVFQQMHHFPSLGGIPAAVVEHARAVANIGPTVRFGYDTQASPTLFRHYAAVREYLGVKPYYGTDAGTIATRAAHTAAYPWTSRWKSSMPRSTS